MGSKLSRLPSRFPVGTKFVIEGRRAGEGEVQVFRRYIEFPDGTHVRLPARPDKRRVAAAAGQTRRPRRVAAKPDPHAGGRV
jgi:hypothetical protein